MFGIGMTELVVIFTIALLVLGPKRLPSMARSLGRTLAEFRRASTDLRREFLEVAEDTRIEPPPSPDPGVAQESVKPEPAPEKPPQAGDDAGHDAGDDAGHDAAGKRSEDG
jgi:Tat protein translocase TatB subunit